MSPKKNSSRDLPDFCYEKFSDELCYSALILQSAAVTTLKEVKEILKIRKDFINVF